MTNVLENITNTLLEGNVRYVNVTDQCNSCGYQNTFYRIDTKDDSWRHHPYNYKKYPKIGDTVVERCHCAAGVTWTVIKVVPNKD